MARNGTWLALALALALAAPATADDALVERWDKPKRESFSLKGALPERVVEELTKRYGITPKIDPLGDDRADFAVQNATVFEALDRFASAHGLFLVGVPAPEEKRKGWQEALALVRPSRPVGATPVAYLGPGRLSVQGLAARSTWVFTAEGPRVGASPVLAAWSDLENEDRLCAVFKWIVEPGLEDLLLVRLKVAGEDDTGMPLRVSPRYLWDPEVICAELPLQANGCFRVYFPPPRDEARAIRKLTGSVEVAIPVERSEIEFRPTEEGAKKPLGGCQVTFVERQGAVARFAFDGLPCREILQTDPVDQITIAAYGADGRAVEASRCGGTVDATRATWWEEWSEPPARVVLGAVTKVVLREAPFAFKDIPLPE